MILSLLHLGLVFYFPLEIIETTIFIPSPSFCNFLKGGSHPESRRGHVTHHEEQLFMASQQACLLFLHYPPLLRDDGRTRWSPMRNHFHPLRRHNSQGCTRMATIVLILHLPFAVVGCGGGAGRGRGDTEHNADRDGRSSDSVLESIADRENYATTGLGWGTGDNEPSSGASTNTSPASQPWKVDASFLCPRLVRRFLLKMA
jgi:hypothetical protein